MKKFIASMVKNEELLKEIHFEFKGYDTMFVSGKYNSYFLFVFLNDRKNLLEIRGLYSEIFMCIKENMSYEVDMDKNITCVFFLKVDNEDYYSLENNSTISDLGKEICVIEEDLTFFKKNVLVYTSDMETFATDNVDNFSELCEQFINVGSFEAFKEDIVDNYKYDFLINLFIKIPFLSYNKYHKKSNGKYRSISEHIKQQIDLKNIEEDKVINIIGFIEQNDDNEIFNWLDKLEID